MRNQWGRNSLSTNSATKKYEPHHEKSCFLHMQKERHISCTADQRLCFCYTDRTILLLPRYTISNLKLSSVAGLCRTWSLTQMMGFLMTWHISSLLTSTFDLSSYGSISCYVHVCWFLLQSHTLFVNNLCLYLLKCFIKNICHLRFVSTFFF